VHALLYGATLLAMVVAVWWVARRNWRAAGVAAVAGGLVYAGYAAVDTVPREFATYAPQLVTLVVLAVASQRLRPPAAIGADYRRGGG
jgi:simple sugar transport system permease protein